jgi:hypothetical protein
MIDTSTTKPVEITRGSALPKKEEPVTEFKRGERMIDTSSTANKVEISRGSALPKKEPEKEVKKDEFVRGARAEPQPTKQAETDSGFSRGTRVIKDEPKQTKDEGFARGKGPATTTTTKAKEPEKKGTEDKWDRGARK